MENLSEILNERIISLERQQKNQYSIVKKESLLIFEGLQPFNLLKNKINENGITSNLKDNILDNVIGLSTGYLSKKIIIGGTHNPIKQILGEMLQFGIGNVVAKHSYTIKAIGELIWSRFNGKKVSKNHLNNEITDAVTVEIKENDIDNLFINK